MRSVGFVGSVGQRESVGSIGSVGSVGVCGVCGAGGESVGFVGGWWCCYRVPLRGSQLWGHTFGVTLIG